MILLQKKIDRVVKEVKTSEAFKEFYMHESLFYRDAKYEGIKEGAQQKAVEDATNLLKENISIETIVKCVGLPLDKVLELQSKIIAEKA